MTRDEAIQEDIGFEGVITFDGTVKRPLGEVVMGIQTR